MEPVFLSLDEVLEIHEQQIEQYGGSSGLRDAAGLESAVATPQATFGANSCTLLFRQWRLRISFISAKTILSSMAINE
ncbi:MAG TPA: hypothetical protein VHY84_06350 [Bryobacteraceae bacterium]|jgi:prophage maintenance system killer protein|nr:hypothetical protein [Bryobacteraceae bacterium]